MDTQERLQAMETKAACILKSRPEAMVPHQAIRSINLKDILLNHKDILHNRKDTHLSHKDIHHNRKDTHPNHKDIHYNNKDFKEPQRPLIHLGAIPTTIKELVATERQEIHRVMHHHQVSDSILIDLCIRI